MPIDSYQITLFGRPAIRHGANEITFSRSVELLFVRLALEPDRWVSREQLAEAVWEDEAERPEDQLLERDLRNPKHRLKSRLGALAEQMLEDDGTARMRLLLTEGSSIDTHVAAIEAKRARDAAAARDWETAREAARRVDGVIVAELAAGRTERWIEAERRRFRETGLEALAHLARAELSLDPPNPHAAREAARRLVSHDDANVNWLMLLMMAECRSGNPHQAQEAYLAFARKCGPPPKKLQELSRALAAGDALHLAEAWHLELPTQAEGASEMPQASDRGDAVDLLARAEPPSGVRSAAMTTRRTAMVATLSAGGTLAATALLGSSASGAGAGKVALQALHAFANRDVQALGRLLDPRVVFIEIDTEPPHSAYRGLNETLHRLKTIRAAFTQLTPKPEPLFESGPVVVYKLVWLGVQQRALEPEALWLTKHKGPGEVDLPAQIEVNVNGGRITTITHTSFRNPLGSAP